MNCFKRLLLALTILAVGGMLLFASLTAATSARQQLRTAGENWLTETQLLADAYARKETVTTHARDLKNQVRERESASGSDSLITPLLSTNGLSGLSLDAKERLQAALGLDWHASTDYVVISKATLKNLHFDALGGNRLTDAACRVLALTPEERAQVDAAFENVGAQFADWAKANVQREGPSGETLVRYTVPAEPQVAQSLTNRLYSAIRDAVGQERGELLQSFSTDWLQLNVGCLGALTNTLTLMQMADSEGQKELRYELRRQDPGGVGSGGESGPLSLQSHFPQTFRAIFPGGWQELAQRERIELPQDPKR